MKKTFFLTIVLLISTQVHAIDQTKQLKCYEQFQKDVLDWDKTNSLISLIEDSSEGQRKLGLVPLQESIYDYSESNQSKSCESKLIEIKSHFKEVERNFTKLQNNDDVLRDEVIRVHDRLLNCLKNSETHTEARQINPGRDQSQGVR